MHKAKWVSPTSLYEHLTFAFNRRFRMPNIFHLNYGRYRRILKWAKEILGLVLLLLREVVGEPTIEILKVLVYIFPMPLNELQIKSFKTPQLI